MLTNLTTMLRTRREHFANFASSIVSKAVSFGLYFAAIPFFLSRQGAESYGIVAFLMVVLGYSSLFDNGITYTITMRYVRALATGTSDPEYVVGCSMPIYAILSSIVMVLTFAFSARISVSLWGDEKLAYVVQGLAFVLFLQIAGSIFACVLLAHNAVVLVNGSRMLADVSRSGGLFLAALSNQPLLVAVAMMCVASTLKASLDIYNCARVVGLHKLRLRGSVTEVVSILRSSTVMWSIAVISLLVLVYDKWYVSSIFTPEKYSYYSIANDICVRVYFVFYAFTGAIYTPLMRKHSTQSSSRNIYRLYVAVLLGVAASYYGPLYFFSTDILTLYVGAETARLASEFVPIMIGSAVFYLLFNVFEINFYTRGLAHLVLPTYLIGAFVLWSLTPLLAARYQVKGVAFAMLTMQAAMLASIVLMFFYERMRRGRLRVL